MTLAGSRDEPLDGMSMAPMLAVVRGALDPVLLSAPAAARLSDTMSRLPDTLTSHFYFEARLDRDPAVDLVLQVAAASRASLLGGGASDDQPLARPAWQDGSAAWERVRALAQAWETASCTLSSAIHHLWLEFDAVGMSRAGRLEPGVFACFGELRGPQFSADRWLRYSMLALRVLLNGKPSPPLRRNLERCFAALPPEAYLPYVGVMLGREGENVRLCVTGIGAADLDRYLAAVGWAHHDRAASELVSELSEAQPSGPLQGAGMVHLDVSPFGVWRVGLEFACERHAQLRGGLRETPMLRALHRVGLATADKTEALLRWPGTSAARVPAASGQRVVVRRLNHVKIVFRQDAPTQAKAYLAARHMPRESLHAAQTPHVTTCNSRDIPCT